MVRNLKTVDSDSSLSFLDVRECHQQLEPPTRDETYVKSMLDLEFDEKIMGIFSRPARWNDRIRKQLVANLS